MLWFFIRFGSFSIFPDLVDIMVSFFTRLLWQTGCSSIMSLYHVGIYSNKELIGKCKLLLALIGINTIKYYPVFFFIYMLLYSNKCHWISAPGETLTIAEEQAAKDALKNLMKTDDARPPFIQSSKVPIKSLDLEKKNPSADLLLKLYSQSDSSEQQITNWP